MVVKLVDQKITNEELKEMSVKMFDGLVKAVVDVVEEVMVVDSELHADQEEYLLEKGSKQENLWGINIYPEQVGKDSWLEFDSMINLRPSQNNKSRSVEDENIRNRITAIVDKLVVK